MTNENLHIHITLYLISHVKTI